MVQHDPACAIAAYDVIACDMPTWNRRALPLGNSLSPVKLQRYKEARAALKEYDRVNGISPGPLHTEFEAAADDLLEGL